MKFTFSGTGTSQGVPVIACSCEVCQSSDPRDKRLRTSGILQSEKTTLVFDTGPDFRQQMLRHDIQHLDAVVFTHQHKDHVAGLDDVRAYNYQQQQPMPIYGSDATLNHLKQEFAYVFAVKQYPGVPKLELHPIKGRNSFPIGDIELQPIPVLHGEMPVLGFRTENFAYVTDANYIPSSSKNMLKGLDILVLNALRKAEHHSHFNLEQALALIEKLQPKQAYLTHISHLMGTHAETSKELPDGVEIAYDGLEVAW
ncbi:MAG: MBL fold metallo-hydrolase [Bacteroidota bacterium]